MKKTDGSDQSPESVRYTHYYEHDGMLRAYANRSMALATIFGVIALDHQRRRGRPRCR